MTNKNSLENKIINFAKQRGISVNRIFLLAKNKKIKDIREVIKYYQYLV